MHYISSITIKNFKSIREEIFELSIYTPLVGYNNAGKSNILASIKWLFNKKSLSEKDFYCITDPIEVSGCIVGITEDILDRLPENQKKSILPYIDEEMIKIKRVQNIPNDKPTNIKLLVWNPETNQWKNNPTGLDGALKSLFPEAIEIGAMENAIEDVSKSKNTTTIGKLIAEIMTPIEQNYATDINKALSVLKSKFDADGINRAEELKIFDKGASAKVEELFPGIQVKLHVPTPEIKEVFKNGTLKIYENGLGRELSSYGHGTQRSVQMALVQHLAEVKKGNNNRITNTLLLIDEPELYLHPQAVEQIRSALKILSKNGYQVLFTTHSPQMIPSEDVKYTLLIRKNEEGTYARTRLISAVEEVETNKVSQFELLFSLENSNQILFSEQVILTEGKTEKRLLPHLYSSYCQKTLGQDKLALIGQGGVGNTVKCMSVLKAMDIPVKAIVDLDYAFKGGRESGLIESDNMDFIACKEKFKENTDISLSDDGLPQKNGKINASEAYKWLSTKDDMKKHIDNLHNLLKKKDIWLWKKGAIEEHLGLSAKNEQTWARFKQQLDEKDFDTIVTDSEMKEMLSWLSQ